MHLSASRPYFIHAAVGRTREEEGGIEGRGRLSNASMRRHRVIRIGKEAIIVLQNSGQQRSLVSSINETFSLDGQQWEWRHVMRETIDPSTPRFFLFKKGSLSYRFLSWKVVIFYFYSISKLRKFSRTVERYIRTSSNIWRSSCLLNMFLRCAYTLLRNSNWHALARYGCKLSVEKVWEEDLLNVGEVSRRRESRMSTR